MRIKLATSSPLPKYNCWFVLSEKNEAQTVHHLRRKIVKDLELNSEPSLLQLSMDGFQLLPQSNIQGLLRDGDLINVEQVNSVKPIIKKRKPSSIEESPPPVKKSKKEKVPRPESKSEKKNSSKPEEKKSSKSSKLEEKKSSKLEEKESSKSEKKKRSKSEEVVKEIKEPVQQKTAPFEGKEQTKKRNMRRRELKRRLRTVSTEPVQKNATTPSVIDQELQIQNLNISNVEPLQLLKKNKNKKKNHMKQMDQRSHVHYPEEKEVMMVAVPEEKEEVVVSNNKNNGNRFGRAFVTFVESEKNYKERQNSNFSQEYPIHSMPTLFYANQGLTENELKEPETEFINQAQPVGVEVVQPVNLIEEEEKEIDYNNLVQANFTDNVPTVGSKLAIKTLELTSTYTPEISDWKHAILKKIDTENGQVKFEFLPGYGKATTKGGKFDNKKNRKRYDDWYDQQQEEEEEEEETEAIFEMTDIFEMRIIS